MKFERISPSEITPQIIKYLEIGAKNFGDLVHVDSLLQNYDPSRDLIIIGKNERLLRTAIYLTITHQEVGKVLTSVLLGGEGLSEWHDELRDFYYKLAREHDCDQFTLMGRYGFKHYFPELEEVATVFRVILKDHSHTIN